MARNSVALSSGSVVTTTTAANVALGNKLMSGDRYKSVADTNAHGDELRHLRAGSGARIHRRLGRSASCGKAMEETPRQIGGSQREQFPVGCDRGSSSLANARPAAMDSVKDMSAIPSAPGHRLEKSDSSGSAGVGRPPWMGPVSATPRPPRPRNVAAAIPSATATSGAGTLGESVPARGGSRASPQRAATLGDSIRQVGQN